MEGIRAIGSGPTTSFMFLAPVFALLIAAALLGERPTALQGAGGALMLLGVWLVNRPREGGMPLKGRGSPASP
jgi:drug/metabolite transporter (DMT)-like permease